MAPIRSKSMLGTSLRLTHSLDHSPTHPLDPLSLAHSLMEGVRPDNLSRACEDRAKLEEAADSGYVACSRKTYRNKMPDKVEICIRFLFFLFVFFLYTLLDVIHDHF